jgi:hypothetical protein
VADPLDFPEEQEADEPWFIEPKDKDPRSESQRQRAFLSDLSRLAPAVSAFAVPNAGKRSDWERLERWREGARKGVLDLVITWNRGVFFAEFKNGQEMPTPAQKGRLNTLYRQGHHCGVYRTPETLLEHLRASGAPFIDRPREQGARPIGEILEPIVSDLLGRAGIR